jgi:DNA-binding transcriptional LysR family regulator
VNVELRQLRYFLAVAEELNFTRAAERLHIAQQPLSAAIARLERQLDVRLLDRTTRRVTLTEAGTALLDPARAALLAADAAVVVRDRSELEAFVRRALEEPDWARTLGDRAQEFVRSQLGATARTVQLVESLLPSATAQRCAA